MDNIFPTFTSAVFQIWKTNKQKCSEHDLLSNDPSKRTSKKYQVAKNLL